MSQEIGQETLESAKKLLRNHAMVDGKFQTIVVESNNGLAKAVFSVVTSKIGNSRSSINFSKDGATIRIPTSELKHVQKVLQKEAETAKPDTASEKPADRRPAALAHAGGRPVNTTTLAGRY